jgi:hypothetical protein
MAQTTDTVDVQILDLIKTRMEAIDGTTTNYYRTVDEVGIIDDLPEERWIAEEQVERRNDYLITLADVTEAVEISNTCTNIASWTLAVTGFFRRKRPQENPWQRKYDSDIQVRREIRSDIYVAMHSPNDQLNMLALTPFPGDVDAILFADAQLEQHWVGVRTLWTIRYKFGRTTPWLTS